MFCARCATLLHPGAGDFYQITIEAVADPSPPIFPGADDPKEIRRRIETLLAGMADVTAQEALDQVYRRMVLQLCTPCYRAWIENPAGG